MSTEEEKRHARLMNIRDVVPSLSGIHYKVHPPKSSKSRALKNAKGEDWTKRVYKGKYVPKTSETEITSHLKGHHKI